MVIRDVLPVPMMNILNGGEHADNNVDLIQSGLAHAFHQMRAAAQPTHAKACALQLAVGFGAAPEVQRLLRRQAPPPLLPEPTGAWETFRLYPWTDQVGSKAEKSLTLIYIQYA